MKKRFLLLATLVLTLALCIGFTFSEVAVAASDTAVSWTVRDSSKDGYTVNDDGSIVTNGADNNGWNFLLCDTYIATGDYSVTADIKGTVASAADGNPQLGIVPWYIDGDNYVVVYVEWWESRNIGTDENPNYQSQMKCVQITGRANGSDLGWHDKWTGGVTTSPADGVKLVVTKSGDTISFNLYTSDGTELPTDNGKSETFSGLSTENAQIGIYGNGDAGATFKVSTTLSSHTHAYELHQATESTTTMQGNIEYYTCSGCDKVFVKNAGGEYVESSMNNILLPKIANNREWTERDNQDAYIVNADGSITVMKDDTGVWNFLLCDSYFATGDYSVTADITGTITTSDDGSAQLGIVPWYIDGDNYVVVYVEWWESRNIGTDENPNYQSQMKCVQITGRANGSDLGWHDKWTDGVTDSPADGVKLVVTKTGETFSFVLYKADGTTTLKSDSLAVSGLSNERAKIGIYAKGDQGANFVVSSTLNVHEHDYKIVDAVDSTCTVKGHDAYYTCEECGKNFRIVGMNYEEIELHQVERPLEMHDFENSTKYHSDGTNHWKVCTNCTAEDTDNKVACSGGEATCVDKAICDVCHNEYGTTDESNHKNVSEDWSSDKSGHWHECQDCHAKIDGAEHVSSGEATEETAETCTICGYEISPILTHEHNYQKVDAVDSTCTEQGHSEYYTCSGCDKLFVKEDDNYTETTIEDVTLAFANHDFENSTTYKSDGTSHWKVCVNCTAEDTDNKVACSGGEANCQHKATCEVCGNEYGVLGEHDFENSDKYKSDWEHHWKVCANCDAEDTDNKVEHSGGTASVGDYAHCEVCSHKYGTTTSVWQTTDRNKDGYTDNGDGTVSSLGKKNEDLNDGGGKGTYFIKTDSVATDKYTLSANILGQNTQAEGGYVKLGLVPWYLDENNYIVVYVQWWENRSGLQMRNVAIVGYINGEWQGWNAPDIWCDGITVAPADGIKLVVSKSEKTFAIELQDANGNTLLKNGTDEIVGSRTFDNLPDGDAKVGVYAHGDIATFSNITLGETSTDTPVVKDLWEKDGENYISNNNKTERGNFKLLDGTVMGSNTIIAKIQGTMTLPNSKEVHAGIIPWYVDEDNYIVVYVYWHNTERPTDIRNIEVTGKINGKAFYVGEGSTITSKEWNDIWCDGIKVAAATGVMLKVETSLTQSGNALQVAVTLMDNEGKSLKSDTVVIRDFVQHASTPAKAGLYAWNDTVTFSDISIVNNTTDNRNFKSEGTFVANGADWSLEDGKYSVDGTSISSLLNNMAIIGNPMTDKSYSISAKATLAELESQYGVGILAWYKDGYNYLYAYVEKASNGKTYIGFKGVYTSDIDVKLTQKIIDVKEEYTGGNIESLQVVKRSANFTFSVGGQNVYVSVDEMLDAANCGFVTYGAKAQFSELKIEEVVFNPFDVYSDNLGGKTEYYISAKDNNSISLKDGVITIPKSAIDETGEKLTYLLWNTKYFDIVSVSAKFNVQADGVYGVYPWYINSENYILVKIAPNGIVVDARFGTWSDTKSISLSEGFEYAGEHTLYAKVNLGTLSVKLDGEEIETAFALNNYDTSLSPKVGIVASVNELTVGEIATDGFKQRDTIKEGDWTFKGGAHANTWTLAQDGSISGDLTGGTEWQNTLALAKAGENKDFYMSSTILVTKGTATEYKVGLVPYYLNSDNFVFVWLSMWTDGSPAIVVTAKLNGKVIGQQWRELNNMAYGYMNTANDVEVKIEGDVLSVYLNKSFNATYTTTIDGLSNRNMEDSYVGLNISNVSATFSNITTNSTDRKFAVTEEPIIEFVTNPATSGTVDNRIKIAIYSMKSASGEVIDKDNITVIVLDPNGNAVELKNNAFTPTMAGNYTVKYSCVDSWGNHSEREYTITIAQEGAGSDSNGNGDEADENDNSALAIGLGVGIPAGVVVIAVVVALIILGKKGIIGKKKNDVEENIPSDEDAE